MAGAVFAGPRLDGVLLGRIERDGWDAWEQIKRLVSNSKFREHIQMIMLQGIALGGFNVVDVFSLHESLQIPVMVISRKEPDMSAIKHALHTHIQGGGEKWSIIQRLGPMEPVGKIYVQRVGLSMEEAAETVGRFSVHSHIPEPIRVAHLIAGALGHGESRGNP
jgi:endonuclease V-like protein UPF0215 family